MFSRKELTNLLFFDIETITEYRTYREFYLEKPKLARLFLDKMQKQNKIGDEDPLSKEFDIVYRNNASLYPEFSKILTISYGTIKWDEEKKSYNKVIKNLIEEDETTLLKKFIFVLNKVTEVFPEFKFCGHNIDGFDIPFLIKRILINKLIVPSKLHIYNLKPWESPTLDTMKVWRFGSFEPTSLDILCNSIGIVSPKTEEVNNKLISEIYYSEDKESLSKILEYCNKDVDAVIDIILYLAKYHNTID